MAGLLASILLTDARRAARTGLDGALIPLAEQDRRRWNRECVEEGVALVADAPARTPLGPYQLQAAIAAGAPDPMVTLDHAVALAMVEGPQAGLDLLKTLEADRRLASHHRLAAVGAHLLEMAGETEAARASYREAARLTTSLPERRYLESRAHRL